ncbi:MAG: DUF4912 domain-containing protein [Candidatus Rokubacteria bacterium]|nr:DUF4912 domain-containing protein [Candidatus Rokubacteria bacterium]
MADDVLVRPTAEAPDLLPAGPPVFGHIPWGYGENRVTAMARDPHWLFVYWEVTDEALATAHGAVGSPGAPCVLRVYDTTYRLFDGTNANSFFDVPVQRPANNHYVRVDRPGSTFHVDIGVKDAGGAFATIARSGPVETPRNAISSDTRVEWMTVTAAGPLPPPYRHRFEPRPASGARVEPARLPEVERIAQSLAGEGWERAEWVEADMHGRTVRWMHWTEPLRRVEIERRVTRTEWGERVTLGPWRVTIYGPGPDGSRRAIDRWAVQYAWLTERGGTRVETLAIVQRILQGYRAGVARGGSEARLMGESWASEALQGGASEWRWLGASEVRLAGASEVLAVGASERRYLGASEFPLAGAGEALFVGASERVGASELLLAGASEARP